MALDPVAFIRRTGIQEVLKYLETIAIKLPLNVNEESPAEQLFQALQVAAQGDPRVWTAFENAEAFAPIQARAALRSVLINERGLIKIFDAMTASNRACALWLAGRRPELFDRAVSALNTSKRIGGKSWDSFEIEGCVGNAAPNLSVANLETFERLARTALNHSKHAMPDGKLKAEPFQRVMTPGESHGQKAWTQITIYAEGPHETRDTISESNEIVPELTRRVDEGAVLFDPAKSTIEVVVLGAEKIRKALAEAFCKAFMPERSRPLRIVKREIDFSKFSAEPDFPLLATDPVEAVTIDEIRFSLPGSDAALVTFENRYAAATPTNIYTDTRSWPEVGQPEQMKSWKVVAVRIRFVFRSDDSTSPRLRTAELKAPNRTNLREKSDADHSVMYELLERWGILKSAEDGDEEDGD